MKQFATYERVTQDGLRIKEILEIHTISTDFESETDTVTLRGWTSETTKEQGLQPNIYTVSIPSGKDSLNISQDVLTKLKAI